MMCADLRSVACRARVGGWYRQTDPRSSSVYTVHTLHSAPCESGVFPAEVKALVRFTGPSDATAPQHVRDADLCHERETPCSKLISLLLAESY